MSGDVMSANDDDKQFKDQSVSNADVSQTDTDKANEPDKPNPPQPSNDISAPEHPDDTSSRMKDQVSDISKKIGRAFSDFGRKFAKESGDVYEQGKQEVRIISLDRKLHDLEADLGRKLYNLWSMGRIRDPLITELLTKELEEIDKYDEEREVAKELLDNIRYKPDGDSK
jgi:hypothetical protein